MIKVGFTGTRDGMTNEQYSSLGASLGYIKGLFGADEVETHDGDCIGSDAEFTSLSSSLGFHTVGHPGDRETLRAFSIYDETHEPKGLVARDHDIVDAVEVMYATPKTFEEVKRSGTWLTIRYALKQKIDVWVIWPNGQLELLVGETDAGED